MIRRVQRRETFQERVLKWVAISFSRGSSQSRDRTQVSRTAGRPSEPPGEPVSAGAESSDPSPSPPGPARRWSEDRGAQCCSLGRVSLQDGHELGRRGREGTAWGNHTPQRPNPDPQPGALTCVLSARYLRPRVTCPGWSCWEGLGEGGSWIVDVGLSPRSFCSTSSFHPDASGCGSLSTDYVQGACPTSTPAHLLPDGPWGSIS